MIMVPRRIANAEICGHLLQTPDISNNNRCPHAGVINNYGAIQYPNGKSYFELTKDLMIDRFEYGCDYTSAIVAVNDCNQKSCYSNQDPVAAGANAGTRYRANAFYDRSSGICYLYDGNGSSGNWMAAGDLNNTQIASEFVSGSNSISVGMRGRLAGLPPLTHISQAKAQAICTARTSTANPITIKNDSKDIILTNNAFRLPSRIEQVAMTAWDTDTYSDTQINVLERGPDLKVSSKCNSSSADTISEFTNAPAPLSAAIHTLPGIESSSIRSLITGSDFTAACASRYEVRSMVGNVREWSGEQFNCSGSTSGCTQGNGQYSSAINGVNLFPAALSYLLNGTSTGPNIVTNPWVIAEEDNAAVFFDFPSALPFAQSNSHSPSVNFEIGQTSGITQAQLHSDIFAVTADSLATAPSAYPAGILYGGSYSDSSGAGRYYGNIAPADTKNTETGFRCIYPIAPTY